MGNRGRSARRSRRARRAVIQALDVFASAMQRVNRWRLDERDCRRRRNADGHRCDRSAIHRVEREHGGVIVIEHAVVGIGVGIVAGIGVGERVMRLGVPVHEHVLMTVIVAFMHVLRRRDGKPPDRRGEHEPNRAQPDHRAMVCDPVPGSQHAQPGAFEPARSSQPVCRWSLSVSFRTASTCPTA